MHKQPVFCRCRCHRCFTMLPFVRTHEMTQLLDGGQGEKEKEGRKNHINRSLPVPHIAWMQHIVATDVVGVSCCHFIENWAVVGWSWRSLGHANILSFNSRKTFSCPATSEILFLFLYRGIWRRRHCISALCAVIFWCSRQSETFWSITSCSAWCRFFNWRWYSWV